MKFTTRRDQHHDKKHYKGKKSQKLLKKMAKLEKKLSKYNFEDTSSENDSCSSGAEVPRSRSHSRSRNKRMSRRHHKHGRAFRFHGRSSSSSSSSSSNCDSSGSSSSSSSGSRSSSPSLCQHRRHRHHGPGARHLSRSKSFAGRSSCSPPPFSRNCHRQHHRHPHPRHHRGRYWRQQFSRRHEGGIRGCLYKALAQSEPNLQEPESQNSKENQKSVDMKSPSRSVSREPEVPAADLQQMEEDVQEVREEGTETQLLQLFNSYLYDDKSVEGREIDATLAKNWTEILQKGLPTDAIKSLLIKYPVSKNCSLLRGPKINKEILHVATETAVNRDILQKCEQYKIGAGMTALGQAISDLNNKFTFGSDKEVDKILETLNEAAVLVADAHHNMTQTRQKFMLPELNKRVRSVVQACEPDEFLYGNDFGEKVKNIKGFRKGKHNFKSPYTEGECEKGGKRKHDIHDGEKRKSKRLESSVPFKKGFLNRHWTGHFQEKGIK